MTDEANASGAIAGTPGAESLLTQNEIAALERRATVAVINVAKSYNLPLTTKGRPLSVEIQDGGQGHLSVKLWVANQPDCTGLLAGILMGAAGMSKQPLSQLPTNGRDWTEAVEIVFANPEDFKLCLTALARIKPPTELGAGIRQ